MRLPKIRELGEAIKAVIKGPCTLPFPKKPSVPFDTFRGQMKWDDAVCVGCGACARVCPPGAIEIVDTPAGKSPQREMIRRYGMCIYCGQCHALCTTLTGCNHTIEYDQVCVERDESIENIRKDLVLCEACGDVITTRDHLRWIYDKLGSLSFTNPTVFLGARADRMATPEPLGREATRADRMRVLCPRCQREVVLADRA
ncbi:MAG: 4Fe-4S binding protein [PVC group bacterium]